MRFSQSKGNLRAEKSVGQCKKKSLWPWFELLMRGTLTGLGCNLKAAVHLNYQMEFYLLWCCFDVRSHLRCLFSPLLQYYCTHFKKQPLLCICVLLLQFIFLVLYYKPTTTKLWFTVRLAKNGWARHALSLYPSLFIAQTIKLRRPSLACCYSARPWVALPASQTGVP